MAAAASTLNKVMMSSPVAILVDEVRTALLVHLIADGAIHFAFARHCSVTRVAVIAREDHRPASLLNKLLIELPGANII
jgi:hypothetical protein